MSHLPSDDQLRRIERGVQRRIDLRRLVARRIAGTAASLAVLVGGIALLGPLLIHSSSGASSSGAGGSSSGRDAALVPVLCHGARTATVRVPEARLPDAAIDACAAAIGGLQPAADGATEQLSGTPSPSTAATRTPAVLCQARDGSLAVYPGDRTACAAHGLTPFPG